MGSLRIQALPTNHEKTRTCCCTCSCYKILCCNMQSHKNFLRKQACVRPRFKEHCAALACRRARGTGEPSIGRTRLNWGGHGGWGLRVPSPWYCVPHSAEPPPCSVTHPSRATRPSTSRGAARPRPASAAARPFAATAWLARRRGVAGGRVRPPSLPQPPSRCRPPDRGSHLHATRADGAVAARRWRAPKGRAPRAALGGHPAAHGVRGACVGEPAGVGQRLPLAAASTVRRRDNTAPHPPRAHTLTMGGNGAGLGTGDCRAVGCVASAHVGPSATQRACTS